MQTRRSLLTSLWLGLLGAVGLESAWVAADLVRPRRRVATVDHDSLIVAGPVERFARGSVTPFPEGRFYLARLEEGGFLALSRRCTHLGCTVPWVPAESRFVCPCHASAFDLRGEVINPPAPRALDQFPIRIENEIVKVDVGRVQQRVAFQPSQVTYPG